MQEAEGHGIYFQGLLYSQIVALQLLSDPEAELKQS